MPGPSSIPHAAAVLASGVLTLASGDNGSQPTPQLSPTEAARALHNAQLNSNTVVTDSLDGMPIIIPDMSLYSMPILQGPNLDAMPIFTPPTDGSDGLRQEVDKLLHQRDFLRALSDSLRQNGTLPEMADSLDTTIDR